MSNLKEVNLSKAEGFDWDKHNREKIWQRHRVNFREAEEVFLNQPLQIFYDQRHSQTEDRFVAYGITDHGRGLAIIFTVRNKRVRIISARDQNRKERKIYAQA